MNEIEYIQKITGLETDIEYLEEDIRKLENKKEEYRQEINKNADFLVELLGDLKKIE